MLVTNPNFATGTVNYGYSTGSWVDLLTNYNGTAITYDSIGNPTKRRGISSLTWNGRNHMMIQQHSE